MRCGLNGLVLLLRLLELQKRDGEVWKICWMVCKQVRSSLGVGNMDHLAARNGAGVLAGRLICVFAVGIFKFYCFLFDVVGVVSNAGTLFLLRGC